MAIKDNRKTSPLGQIIMDIFALSPLTRALRRDQSLEMTGKNAFHINLTAKIVNLDTNRYICKARMSYSERINIGLYC